MKFNIDELGKQKIIDLPKLSFMKGWEDLRDDDLDDLIKVIEQSTVLERLNLSGNNLTLADGKLAKAIAKNTSLKVLSLHNNNIGTKGAKHLADILKKNNTLEVLGLNSNHIGNTGAKFIADMLAVNKTLQVIELDKNNIGDKGALSIATSLFLNTGIQGIFLRYNKIGDAGAEKLADALITNHSIKILNLDDNNISKFWAGIGGNNISNRVLDRIRAILDVPSLKRKEIIMLKHVKDDELMGKDAVIAKISRDNDKKDLEIASLKESLRNSKPIDIVDCMVKHSIAKNAVEKNAAIAEKEDALKSIASMKADITRKEEELDGKDAIIAKKDDEITALKNDLASKEKEILSLKGALESYKPVTVDLASEEEDEPSSKRARTSTSDTSMEIWDKDTPRIMTRHQNQMNRASEKPIVKVENKVMGFKRCPFPQCNTIGLFTRGCSIVTCRMNMRHNGKFHHFCFYCGKSASDPGDSCNNGVCPYKIDEESRKLYQEKLDEAFMEFSRQTRQAGGAYDVDKV